MSSFLKRRLLAPSHGSPSCWPRNGYIWGSCLGLREGSHMFRMTETAFQPTSLDDFMGHNHPASFGPLFSGWLSRNKASVLPWKVWIFAGKTATFPEPSTISYLHISLACTSSNWIVQFKNVLQLFMLSIVSYEASCWSMTGLLPLVYLITL